MMTLLFIMACIFSVRAQSLHAAKWYYCGCQFDFTKTPLVISCTEINNTFPNNTVWYIDEKGQHILTVADKVLYDRNMNPIPTNDEWHGGFFVPMPGNEKMVYYIELGRCHLIDIENKTTTDTEYVIDIDAGYHIAVHNAQCDKVWLVDTFSDTVWHEYLISADGIEKVRDIVLVQDNYKYSPNAAWNLALSVDCKHYTLTHFYDKSTSTEVYYGDFDRNSGLFVRKASHDFGQNYMGILWSAITSDNSRIYYTVLTTDRQYQVLEVPIWDGLPKYDNIAVIVSKPFRYPFINKIFHAIDNKIYCFEIGNGCISSLHINEDGNTVYEVIFQQETILYPTNLNPFISTWLMADPCNNNPCNDHMKPLKIICE